MFKIFKNDKTTIHNKLIGLFLFLLTALIVYVNMAISPKYPIAYAQYNQTIYYLIARMMKNGKIPFVDMVDHKGIYVFLIHYFAEVICEYNHIGLYVVAVVFIYVSALYIYKIIYVLNSRVNIPKQFLILMSMLGAVIYIVASSLYNISFSTLQSETFINAGIILSLYYLICDIYIENEKFDYKHTFIYGIVFAFILFSKANYNLFFAGIALYIFLKTYKDKKALFKHIISGIVGVLLGLLPGIIYAVYTNSLSEMIYNTFTINILYSKAPYFGTSSKMESLMITIDAFKYYFLFLVLGMLTVIVLARVIYKDKLLSKTYKVLSFIMLLIMASILFSLRDYTYYLIVSLQFVSIIISAILIFILLLFDKLRIRLIKYLLSYLLVVMIVFPLITISNTYGKDKMIENGKEQLQIAEFAKSYYDTTFIAKKNKKLLVVGLELYVYSHLDVLPDFKYFALPIIEMKYYDKPYMEICEYINSAKADILLVGTGSTIRQLYKYTDFSELLNNNYKSISSYENRTILRRR